jgi:hypothetical protein
LARLLALAPVPGVSVLWIAACQPLFRVELAEGLFTGTRWCPTGDAQRFLLMVPVGGPGAASFDVVSGWPGELRRKP